MGRVLVIRTVQALEKNQAVSETGFNCQLTKIKVNSICSGHCRELELVSSLAGVRNCGSLFQSNISFFAGELAAVRIIGVSVLAGCPQGENFSFIIFANLPLQTLNGNWKQVEFLRWECWTHLGH